MNLYGVVINISGMEPSIKLVEEDVYKWVIFPNNPKAKIDVIPASVYDKFYEENKHMNIFQNNTNELKKPEDYENAKAELAPAYKSGFDSIQEAKEFTESEGNVYGGTVIKYLRC